MILRELEKLPVERRQRLASYLVRRCYLVVVSTPDTDSAYRIFSVLNNRGLDLSHADILKAEIIGKIDGEALQKAYAKKWEEVEEEVGRDAFKDLFGHVRMMYRRAKLEGTVLAEFRKFVVEKVPEPKKLVDDVIVAGAWRSGSNVMVADRVKSSDRAANPSAKSPWKAARPVDRPSTSIVPLELASEFSTTTRRASASACDSHRAMGEVSLRSRSATA